MNEPWVKKAGSLLAGHFGHAPTIFEIVALDLLPRRTAALCAVVMSVTLKDAGVRSYDLQAAVADIARSRTPAARARVALAVSEATREAERIAMQGRIACEKWAGEERERVRQCCFGIIQEARDRARMRGA